MKLLQPIAAIVLAGSCALTYADSGTAWGNGTGQGGGVAHGEGTASGTGAVFYRNQDGNVRMKQGTGTVDGRGVAVGRGTVTGQGQTAGRGHVAGQGGARHHRWRWW